MALAELHVIDPRLAVQQVSTSWLSELELERAGRFVFQEDADRWSVFRAALRMILGRTLGIEPADVSLTEGAGGKPALADDGTGIEFNLSHTDDLALVLVSGEGAVGVDLEPWSRADSLLECVDSFCHPEEAASLPDDQGKRARRLLEIWTAKEALLKALGTGLSYPPQKLRVAGNRGVADQPLAGLGDFHLLFPDHPLLSEYRSAVAVPVAVSGIEILH